MSDDTLEESLNSRVNTENFNKSMEQVKLLEVDIVYMLGEDKQYIEQLGFEYMKTYLFHERRVETTNEYLKYRRKYMEHLLDIVKVKHFKYYDEFKKRYKL